MSEFKPILPGSSEFTQAAKLLERLPEAVDPMEVRFDELTLPGTQARLRHTVVPTSDTESKIIILLTHAKESEMEKLTVLLRKITTDLAITGGRAEAEVSPILRKQFDYVLFGVPSFRATSIMNFMVSSIVAVFN